MIAFKEGDRAIFVYGFPKNEKENISSVDKERFKKLARFYLGLRDDRIAKLLKQKALVEIL